MRSDSSDPGSGGRHVRRERILRAVAAADPGVLVIVAPAGWGKSSLLADWIATRTGPVLRVTLAPRHADADAFLEACAHAAARATGEPAHTWTARCAADGRPPVARFRTLLAHVPEDGAVALDDVHTIAAGADAAILLDALIEHTREARVRVALATRQPPACVQARDLVHGHALRLDTRMLALDGDEAAAFLAGTPAAHDAALLAEAVRRTHGWPAGLRVLRHRMMRDPDTAAAVVVDDAALADYFDAEVLAPLEAERRAGLFALALLDRIDAAACRAIGAGEALPFVEALACEGFFVARDDDALRLHPMLREHLRTRLQAERPGHVAACLGRLAEWHAAQGRKRESLECALEALDAARGADPDTMHGAGERAATRAEAAAPELLEAGRRDVVLAATARIPDGALHARPYLHLLTLWMRGAYDDAPAEVPAAPAARCMHYVLRAAAALRAGRYDDLTVASLAARAAAPHDDAFLRNMVVAVLQTAFRFGGDPHAGRAAIAEAEHLAGDVRRPAAAVQAGAMLGILLIMHGRLHAAEDALRRALAIADAHLDPASPVRGLAHQFLGYVLYEWNRLDDAAHHLEQARALATPVAHRGILTGTLRVLAIVQLRRGDAAAADTAMRGLEELVDRPDTDARNREWLDGVRAGFAIAAGTPGALPSWIARQQYDPTAIAQLPAPSLHARLQEYTTLAQALILLGRCDEAERLAAVLTDVARDAGRSNFVITAAATLAAARESLGRRSAADDALAQALAAAAPELMVRPFADTPGPLGGVLARARPNGVPLAFLERVRRGTGQSAAPAGLTDRERDVLVLLAGGRSNKALAQSLGVSVSTVKTHLHHAFRKLGARSRTHALARARALGVLDESAPPTTAP